MTFDWVHYDILYVIDDNPSDADADADMTSDLNPSRFIVVECALQCHSRLKQRDTRMATLGARGSDFFALFSLIYNVYAWLWLNPSTEQVLQGNI